MTFPHNMSADFPHSFGGAEGMPPQFKDLVNPLSVATTPQPFEPEPNSDRGTAPEALGYDDVIEDELTEPTAHEAAVPFTGAVAMSTASEQPAEAAEPAEPTGTGPVVEPLGESVTELTSDSPEPVEPTTDPTDNPPLSYAERHNTLSEIMDTNTELSSPLTADEQAAIKEEFAAAVKGTKANREFQQTSEQAAIERYETSRQGTRNIEIEGHYDQVAESIADEGHYTDHGYEGWPVSDSPLLYTKHSMDTTFRGALPEGSGDLKQYIEGQLADVDEPTGLEVGGTGRNMFGQFEPGLFSKTVSINLTDTGKARLPELILEQHDAANHHTVIAGNATTDAVKEQAAAAHNGQGYDVIIQRLLGGVATLPKEPFFIAQQAADYYDMLSDKGMMFMQVTSDIEPVIEQWKDHVTAHYPGLDVQVAASGHENFKVVRIQKLEGAPEHLPLFSARTMARWLRDNTWRGMPL